ncbi:crossover junction endonuclease EME1 isoform X2 [Panulirus ornatus]|uniref:crossover junction endonuclease EME1 isoform X2 n=1 Tax=Panulirus ornatus TaxID=150431 RepID=UPI003A897116
MKMILMIKIANWLMLNLLALMKNQSSQQVEDTNFKYVAKRLLVEEVHKEKETRRKQREIEKQRKAIEKAEAKARREAEKKMKHALKPGECMKYVIVQLDRQLLELAEGSQVISHLQNADLRYRVVDSPVAATTTILRVDPLTLQETLAEEAVVVMALNEFLDLVKHQVYEGGLGLCQRYCEWKQRLGNANITLVVCGIDAYFRNEKMGRQHDFRSAVLGETAKPVRKKKPGKVLHCTSAVHVSRVDIEMVLVNAQLECGLNHRFMSDSTKVATFILQFTKAVAETPFKREKGQPLFSWYAEGNREATVKVDRSGVGLLKLWHQQLRQFNNVGVEVAQAIAREYPSPQALVQAYRKCQTHREASLLLADISVRRQAGPLVSTRRVGPELSKKIHVFFTTRDPEITLG